MDSATFWAWVFGFASIISLILALYIYFKSREYVYPLIEKLKASRNNFLLVEKIANRIVAVVDSKDAPEDKLRQIRQLSRTIAENIHLHMNTIDDGINWGEMNAKAIYGKLK